jgi:hypothetical protein
MNGEIPKKRDLNENERSKNDIHIRTYGHDTHILYIVIGKSKKGGVKSGGGTCREREKEEKTGGEKWMNKPQKFRKKYNC